MNFLNFLEKGKKLNIRQSQEELPFFYIMMPTFNRADLSLRAIKSILEQDYENYNVIIFNDGSLEDYSRVEDLVKSDNRIKYIKMDNIGLNKNKNFMIDQFRKYQNRLSAFLMVLDDDDFFIKDAFKLMAEEISQRPSALWFCFNNYVISKIKFTNKKYKKYKKITYKQYRYDYHGDGHMVVYFPLVERLHYPAKFFKNGFEHIYFFKIQSPIIIVPRDVKNVDYQEDGFSNSDMYRSMDNIGTIFKHVLLDPKQKTYYYWLFKRIVSFISPKELIKSLITEERYYSLKRKLGLKVKDGH